MRNQKNLEIWWKSAQTPKNLLNKRTHKLNSNWNPYRN